MTALGTLATARLTRRLWGAGAASFGLLAQAVAEVHGPVPVWLDRPLAIAPELGCELHWEHMARLVDEASGWLHAAGVRSGDTVAVVKAHNIDVIALAQAAARIGAIPALIAPEFDAATVAELLTRLGKPVTLADRAAINRHRLGELDSLRRVICVDGTAAGALPLEQLRGAAAPPPRCRNGDQLVAVTHTSGTTGVPKLIGHTADSLVGQAAVQVLGGRLLLRSHDVVATCLTTAHARTLSGPFTVAAVGAPHLAMVDPDPVAAATLLARYRPTLLETFPNVFLRWGATRRPPRPATGERTDLPVHLRRGASAHDPPAAGRLTAQASALRSGLRAERTRRDHHRIPRPPRRCGRRRPRRRPAGDRAHPGPADRPGDRPSGTPARRPRADPRPGTGPVLRIPGRAAAHPRPATRRLVGHRRPRHPHPQRPAPPGRPGRRRRP